ncbi:putative pentatricopeptide repeat-containing protein [Hordeum vulgare]|nr:putative pentatricopeptide repeat-containing protein [Hordeum vulgare]
MLAAGARPNGHTFPSILRFASASGPATTALHAQCLRCGLMADRFIVCSLVSSYGRAGRLGCDASKVFDEMASPDLVSSNAMLDVLCLAGDVAAAREFFERMVEWMNLYSPVPNGEQFDIGGESEGDNVDNDYADGSEESADDSDDSEEENMSPPRPEPRSRQRHDPTAAPSKTLASSSRNVRRDRAIKACEIGSKYAKVESEKNQLQLDLEVKTNDSNALKKSLEDKDKVLAELKERCEAVEKKLSDVRKLEDENAKLKKE